MQPRNSADQPARRAFFKKALVGAAVAASAAANPAQAANPARSPRKNNGRGYRETPAIRQYYQLARDI